MGAGTLHEQSQGELAAASTLHKNKQTKLKISNTSLNVKPSTYKAARTQKIQKVQCNMKAKGAFVIPSQII